MLSLIKSFLNNIPIVVMSLLLVGSNIYFLKRIYDIKQECKIKIKQKEIECIYNNFEDYYGNLYREIKSTGVENEVNISTDDNNISFSF